MLNRRHFIQGVGGLALGTTALGSYAFGVEPELMLGVTRYNVAPAAWPADLRLKIAIIADIHACEPWMSAARVREIAEVANALNPDLTVLLGDFSGGHKFVTGPVMPEQWAEALSVLKAPLGCYAVLGNHDWWHGPLPGMKADGAEGVRRGLRQANIRLLENDAVRLTFDGKPFWLLGLADQMAWWNFRSGSRKGADDLGGTLRQVKDDAPAILLAHEPFIFPRVPDRVALTLCGHTHGGQVNLPFAGPILAEGRFAPNLIYGHSVEGSRHIVISAGLGTSIVPVRFLRPPEVVEVTVSGPASSIATPRLES
ncbi:MAG: metallophosphoesterase [Beijerinckiaceae bacterium]